jgi:hypothetical protein
MIDSMIGSRYGMHNDGAFFMFHANPKMKGEIGTSRKLMTIGFDV